jgi:hypothetical protein
MAHITPSDTDTDTATATAGTDTGTGTGTSGGHRWVALPMSLAAAAP